MALTPSFMLPLGTQAPHFDLPEPATGKNVSLDDFADAKALLVAFICNHCPYVIHIRSGFAAFCDEMAEKGLAVVAINANNVEKYPADSPEKMVEEAKAAGYHFPYLYDASQETAMAYKAACTPDFFLFDEARKLVYRGQLDDSRPGNGKPVTGRDLRAAVEKVLAGETPSSDQMPSMGCNIKWKPGNEPENW